MPAFDFGRQAARTSPCTVCGVPVPYRTSKATCCKLCALERRRATQRKAAGVQRAKRRVLAVKGTPADCDRCHAAIVRRSRNHRLCDACAPEQARARARTRQNCASRAAGKPRFGEARVCRHCGEVFIYAKSTSAYCAPCSELSNANKLPHNRVAVSKWRRTKLTTDPKFAINARMRHAVRKSLNGGKAGRPWETLVGYTAAELMRHLERQFVKGMSWENRGAWEIDHIVPLSSFRLVSTCDPEFRAA